MKRFLIKVITNWCGEDQTYGAYAESEESLYEVADELAYENFTEFNGPAEVLSELFPDIDPDEYTEEMLNDAAIAESEYYSFYIREWDESNDDEWENYSIVYNEEEDSKLVEEEND